MPIMGKLIEFLLRSSPVDDPGLTPKSVHAQRLGRILDRLVAAKEYNKCRAYYHVAFIRNYVLCIQSKGAMIVVTVAAEMPCRAHCAAISTELLCPQQLDDRNT